MLGKTEGNVGAGFGTMGRMGGASEAKVKTTYELNVADNQSPTIS